MDLLESNKEKVLSNDHAYHSYEQISVEAYSHVVSMVPLAFPLPRFNIVDPKNLQSFKLALRFINFVLGLKPFYSS